MDFARTPHQFPYHHLLLDKKVSLLDDEVGHPMYGIAALLEVDRLDGATVGLDDDLEIVSTRPLLAELDAEREWLYG